MKVAPNCCIYLGRDKHYYSVPFQHIGKKVHVEYTRTIVKVYSEGQLVATHKRDYAPEEGPLLLSGIHRPGYL